MAIVHSTKGVKVENTVSVSGTVGVGNTVSTKEVAKTMRWTSGGVTSIGNSVIIDISAVPDYEAGMCIYLQSAGFQLLGANVQSFRIQQGTAGGTGDIIWFGRLPSANASLVRQWVTPLQLGANLDLVVNMTAADFTYFDTTFYIDFPPS